MALKYCPSCGNKLEPDASFCDACGNQLYQATVEEVSIPTYEQTTYTRPAIKQESVVYADFGTRIVAFIIDLIIIGIIGAIFSWIIFMPIYGPFSIFNPFGGGWYISYLLDWLIGFLYHWGLEAYNNGQTVGKMALNLRTVDENTLDNASSKNYAINNIFKGSPFLIIDLIVGVLKNSEDPKRRFRLMQNVSETVVIKTK